jgi:hypothetical protein
VQHLEHSTLARVKHILLCVLLPVLQNPQIVVNLKRNSGSPASENPSARHFGE